MANVKLEYGTSNVITEGLEGLASSAAWTAGWESNVIDNSTNKYLDFIIDGKITVGTTPTANTEIRIYVFGVPDGTTYPDVMDGTSSAETVTSEGIRDGFAKLAAVMRCDSTTSDRAYPFCFNVASLFGGVVPKKFGIFVAHNTGVNLNATANNQVIQETGVYITSA